MSKVELWKSKFGDDYQQRCVPTEEEIQSRTTFFMLTLNLIANGGRDIFPKSILEVGAGNGSNMIALAKILSDNGLNIKLAAAEPNALARNALKEIPKIEIYDFEVPYDNPNDMHFDLVFTSGVLIHIPPDLILPAMRSIYKLSNKYVLCMEYFSPEERMIPYRGQTDALWSRDYGKIFLDNFDLRCIGYGFLWRPITKLDNLTWTLLEKVN